MKKRLLASLFVAAALMTVGPARAQDESLLILNAGVFDLVSHHSHEFEARAEYRFANGFFGSDDGMFRGFKPLVGFMGNTAKAFFGYAGFAAPFAFDNGRWEIVPAAGLGAYHKGDGIDLGGTFEFHLGLSGSYAVTDRTRVGLAFDHISNANTHAKNPGANSILVTWAWAFDGL